MNKNVMMMCVAGLASLASAQGTDGTVRFNGTAPFGGFNGGGEFDMSSVSGPYFFGNFQTFCVELNENLSPGTTYKFDVASEARNGGAGGPSPDPLDARTAALYDAFAGGSLAFYDADNSGDGGLGSNLNRRRSAEALQAAIWEIEQEQSIEATTGNNDVRMLANFYVDVLAQQLVDAGFGDRVRILNMYRMNGGNAQDVLVLVPLPQAGALATLGLAGLAVRRRR